MQVQEIIIQKKSCTNILTPVQQLMSDPEIRIRIIKVIIQTLYNLGYEKSAKQLQKESGIVYYDQTLLAMKACVRKQQFQTARQHLKHIRLEDGSRRQVERYLSIMECQHYIQQRDAQKALKVLALGRIEDRYANELCEKIVFQEFLPMQDQEQIVHQKQILVEKMIEKCLEHDIEPRSMQKIVLFYIKLQKEGLIETIDDSFSLLNIDRTQRNPPMKVTCITKDTFQVQINFIKFNHKGNMFITVGSDGDTIQMHLYDNPNSTNKFKRILSHQMDVQQTIQHVCWSECQDQIAVASKRNIYIFNQTFQEINTIMDFKNLLCCQFNPISNLLYCSGYFNYISVYAYNGQEMTKIQPTFKARSLVFNKSGTKMYTFSITLPKLVLINLFEQKQEASLTLKSPIMSMQVQNNGKVIITNQDYIYILSENLIVLNSFTSPTNNGHLLLESRIFQSWIVTMGETFTAHSTSPLSTSIQGQSISWPGEGAFTVHDDMMISGKNQLILWRSGQADQGILMDQKSSSQESQVDIDQASQMDIDSDADSNIDLDS